MRTLRIVFAEQVREPGPKRMIQLLHATAMREVRADPVGTLARYQPAWVFPLRGGWGGLASAESAANGDRFWER